MGGNRLDCAIPASYRDPAGFVIHHEGSYKRVVTSRGIDDYDYFVKSGLSEDLVSRGLLVDHYEEPAPRDAPDWARLLVPEQIPFISYPYEWSFDELRDAALLTLAVQSLALERGLTLKDASACNVQFRGAKPVFIDTLSFQRYDGGPWAAYEQFCKQFLGPLLLMRYRWPDAARYLRADLEGFDIGQVSRMLPLRTYLKGGPLLHIHLHARATRRRPIGRDGAPPGSEAGLRNLIASLRHTVERIRTPIHPGAWEGYYEQGRFYPPGAQESKRQGVTALAEHTRASVVFDLGANTGVYSREMAAAGATCVAFDSDSGCVNRLYLEERDKSPSRILPLVMDLANPSPALGFELRGTLSLFERPQADLVLCLALLHHLRVSANLPFARIAEFLARLGRWLLIEFVPISDPAVETLTRRQADFEDYSLPGFLESFSMHFRLHASRRVAATERTLYLFERCRCPA